MATTKITVTLEPAEYRTLLTELTEARDRHEGKRNAHDTSGREKLEHGQRVVRLDKLLKEL